YAPRKKSWRRGPAADMLNTPLPAETCELSGGADERGDATPVRHRPGRPARGAAAVAFGLRRAAPPRGGAGGAREAGADARRDGPGPRGVDAPGGRPAVREPQPLLPRLRRGDAANPGRSRPRQERGQARRRPLDARGAGGLAGRAGAGPRAGAGAERGTRPPRRGRAAQARPGREVAGRARGAAETGEGAPEEVTAGHTRRRTRFLESVMGLPARIRQVC